MLNQRNNCKLNLFLIGIVFVFSTDLWAQYYTGPAASALGGAGRAAAHPSEMSMLNPATLVHAKRIYFAGHYANDLVGSESQQELYGATVLDGTGDNFFPGALDYSQKKYADSRGVVTEQNLQFSVGQWYTERWSLGISGRRQSQLIQNGPSYADYNYTIGILFVPSHSLGLALIGYDLARIESDRMKSTLGFGSHYIYEKFLRLRFDVTYPLVVNPDKRWNWYLGAEFPMLQEWFLRVGNRSEEVLSQRYFTAGLGWSGPRLGLDYAFQLNQSRSEEKIHQVDFNFFF